MKWIDYRDALGIGFSDDDKAKLLLNRLHEMCNCMHSRGNDEERITSQKYFIMVCEQSFEPSFYDVFDSIKKEQTGLGILSKAVALHNSTVARSKMRNQIYDYLLLSLDDINFQYEIVEDEDGMFVFPKGAEELDHALVSEPLKWLNDYPNARQAYIKALRAYSDMSPGEASETADSMRKALELFFKEFFGIDKGLDKMKTTFGNYLGEHGLPKELSNDFQTVLQQYKRFNDEYAKHNDKTPGAVLEYLLYATGNIMRLLLSLRKKECGDE